MPEPPELSIWDTLASLFRPFEAAGGVVAVLTFFFWLIGLPAPALYVTGAVAFTLITVGLIGQVKMSREQSFLTLGNLRSSIDTPRRRLRPQSNLVLARIEYVKLYVDDADTFWEIQRGARTHASYCAVLRFANEAVAGRVGQPIRGLRARLLYRSNRHDYNPVDRGAWVREEYNAFTLEVGDSRLLVVAVGVSPDVAHIPNIDRPTFAPANNHYSKDNYGNAVFMQLEDPSLNVDVRLVAGEGGHVMYEGKFTLQTAPQLLLAQTQN